MHCTAGHITIVQEGRFRFVSHEGRPMHFLLSHGANLEPQDLPPLQRQDVPVRVLWDDAPGMIASVAHDVCPLRHLKEALA